MIEPDLQAGPSALPLQRQPIGRVVVVLRERIGGEEHHVGTAGDMSSQLAECLGAARDRPIANEDYFPRGLPSTRG